MCVSKACRVYECQRFVGCMWVLKAYKVCGCQRLVGCVWVSKACSEGVEGL